MLLTPAWYAGVSKLVSIGDSNGKLLKHTESWGGSPHLRPTESDFLMTDSGDQYRFKALYLILIQPKHRRSLYRVLEKETHTHMAIAGMLPVLEASPPQKALLITKGESTFHRAERALFLSFHAAQNQ